MSPHHSDQMSQRSQVSRIAFWRCSLNVFVFVIVFVFVFVFVFVIFWSGHVASSHWSNVSKVTSLWGCFLKVFSKCICLCHCNCLCLCLCHCLFVGQVMSSHHSDQMSQTSQVSRVTLLLCFQKVSQSVSEWVSDKVTYWAVGWTAKNWSKQNKCIEL